MAKPKKILVAAADLEVDKKIRESSQFDRVLYCGIGSHAATAFAAQNMDVVRGADVLLIGSCGVFGGFEAPELFSVRTAAWRPQSYRQSRSRMLDGDLEVLSLSGGDQGLKEADCICASALSFDPAYDDTLVGIAENRNLVENMELYSLARVWLPVVSSFSAVLGSTNAIGPDVHNQWKTNFAKVRELTAKHLLES